MRICFSPPALTLICSRRGAGKSTAPVRRRECPLDIRGNPVSPSADAGEGGEPCALRAILFTLEVLK